MVEPMINLDGYELILGSSMDSQFGPVLLFGSGGELVEVMKDYVLGLPTLNATLARRMMGPRPIDCSVRLLIDGARPLLQLRPKNRCFRN